MKTKLATLLNNKYLVIPLVVIMDGLVTILNGYPILYSDSSTYLSSGFELETPFDRPITYGILLRIFSLNGLSLLLVPVFQSLIFTYVLYRVLIHFGGSKAVFFRLFIFSLVLLLTAGFNWSLNQLLPDFLTAIGFLSGVCILFKNAKPLSELPLFFLFFISTASHISNLLVYTLIVVLILVLRKKFLPDLEPRLLKIKSLVLLFLVGLSYLIAMSAISKSKDVFYAGSLAQKGILQKILEEKCPEAGFKLCAYKDAIPQSFDYFVWNEKSPLYTLGGWRESRAELKKINRLTFTEPRYMGWQLRSSFLSFLKQLTMFGVGEGNGPFDENTTLIKRIKQYVALDENLSTSSGQSKGRFLNLSGLNTYYAVMMLLSLIILAYLLITNYRGLDKQLKCFILLVFVLLILSAAQVAFSSEISNRHGCKLMWLIILLDFIILTGLIKRVKPLNLSRQSRRDLEF